MYTMAGTEVTEMARQILEKDHNHLLNANISYLFRDTPWKRGDGRTILGRAARRNEIDKLLSQKREDFIIIVVKPRWDAMSEEERRCLLDHELCHCFIRPEIPILTVGGEKLIKSIRVGDLVLTHLGRFRKVYKIFKVPRQKPKVITTLSIVTDGYSGGWNKWNKSGRRYSLTLTGEHRILVNGKWAEAKDIKVGDNVSNLASTCKGCGRNIPLHRKYCSQSCQSRSNMVKHWHNPEFRFINAVVKEVKNWIPRRRYTLYNLGVEEDESYIAKGIVVHNCGVRVSTTGERQWILRSHTIEEFPENLARFAFRRESMGVLIEHPPSPIVVRQSPRRLRPVT